MIMPPDANPMSRQPMRVPPDFEIHYAGIRYNLGISDQGYFICEKIGANQEQSVVAKYDLSESGWQQAWAQFSAWEPNAYAIGGEAAVSFSSLNNTAEKKEVINWQDSALSKGPADQPAAWIPKLTYSGKVKKRLNILSAISFSISAIGLIARLYVLHEGKLPSDQIPYHGHLLVVLKVASYGCFAVAFIFGILSRKQILRSDSRQTGTLLAWLAILVGWAFILFALGVDLWPKIISSYHSL
jgi:hypothetical protein